ncbi:putative ribonuclease H-like domain-containing protein [Tanacetum coccineum]|uniref:Ribonuclease H-like domain-containing protein n=1 Tax=Tanacetum coccineum TaxID=301880 RepID=A0ABQ4ZJ69_9ASTR
MMPSSSQEEIPPPPPPPPSSQTPTQQTPHTVSTIKLPILKKGEYDIWAMKMEHYLAHTDYPIWEVIQNGNGPVSITIDTSGQIKVLPPRTAEEIVARERERKARTTLLMALPEDHLAKFHKMTDAKEMWDAIKSRFGGNDESKKMQKYILKQQFEGFSVSNTEGLHKGYDRFQSLLSQLEIHDSVSTEDANTKNFTKISTCLPVHGSLPNTEEPNQCCPQLDHEDLEQIDEYDLEEIDLKWQVAMILMRMKKFYKKTGRKLQFDAKEAVGFDKTKVECYNYHKTAQTQTQSDASIEIKAYSQGLKKVEAQLVAHQQGQLWYEQKIKFMKIDLDDKTDSVFRNKESDLENQPLNDRFAEGMHATQPSESESQSSECDTCESNISTEPSELVSEPVVIESNVESQPKVWSDAPIIEEYESDSDDEWLMTGNKAYLDEFQDFNGGPVAFGGSKGYITGKEFKLPDENQVLLKIPRQNNMYSFNLENIVPTEDWLDKIARPTTDNLTNGILGGWEPRKGKLMQEAEALRKKFETLVIKEGAAKPSISTASPYEGLSLDDPTHSEEDDLEIPPLEEIYQNSTDGIFTTSSYDDEGAVADFTNLDNVYVQKQKRTNHNDFHHCLFACFLSQHEPKEISEALEDESWVDAMQEEFGFYRNKKDERGVVVRNKAMLVAQGHRQEEGIDYDEVFAQTRSKVNTSSGAHAFVSYVQKQKRTNHKDFHHCLFACFLSQHEPKKISEALDPKYPKKVYKVVKALYGLHQAPRAWYATLSTFLLKNGYRRGTIDKTLFLKKDKNDIILVQVYVDDIIFGSTKKSWCDEFEALMKSRFQMSSMGELTFFLGLQVKQKEDGIFISQDKYVAEILKKFDFANVKTASTPIETQKPLVKDEEASDVDVHLYRSMIGSLMYLTASRPDIMFAVCACSRFQVTPKSSHLSAVKRIFRYLKGKPKLGLWYPKVSSFDLESYSDSDYAGVNLDRKSTIGGCQFLGRRLISWQCKKQTIVATSTTEAEYVAAASCCGQVLWIQNQMLDYGFNFMNTKIYIDNESTICIVKNPVYHSKTKHIAIRHHFIRDAYEKKLIQVLKIHTDDNVADLLTKAFDVSRGLKEFRESLRRVTDGTEALLIPTLFILWLDKVSTDSANLVPLGKVCIALEVLKKNTAKALISLLTTISLSSTMAVLDSCPKHNMVAFLEKYEGNAEFHEIIDFLKRSSIHHALTVSPVVSTTFVEQFWTSAKSKTINNVRHITAKVAGKSVSISEASIRSDLLFDDADGIDSLPNQAIFDAIQLMGYEGDLTDIEAQPTPSPAPTSEVPNEPQTDSSPAQTSEVPIEETDDQVPRTSPTPIIPDFVLETLVINLGVISSSDKSLYEGMRVSDQAKEIQLLKAQITKLKKQAKPVIKHHRAWLKSVSLKQRFPSKSFSKKHRVHKESVSKQGRKVAKGESSVQRDPLFDTIPEDSVDHMETENAQDEGRTREMVDEDKEIDSVDHMETENAQDEGRTREMVDEDKEIDEIRLSTEDVLSTDKEGVSTDKEKVSTDRPIVSTDGSKISTDEHIEGTEEHNEGTEEHIEGTEEQIESTEEQREGTEEKVESTDGQRKGTEDQTEEEIAAQATQTPTQTHTLKKRKIGVELKDIEEADRPRPTSKRSLLTLKPLPKIDPKDKGKKKIEEEDESESESDDIPQAEKKFKQLESDEELARKMQEEWEEEEERNKIAEEKAANEALIRNFDGY